MKGYALVEGTEPYDVEFVYSDGMIYALTCSCYCVGNCKHEVAAMQQLREMLEEIGFPEELIINSSMARLDAYFKGRGMDLFSGEE